MNSNDPLFDADQVFGDATPDYDLMWDLIDEMPDEDEGDVYRGRRVRWLGRTGKMLRLDWDQVYSMQLNVFEPSKVATFAEMIRQGYEPVLQAPIADVTWVDADSVAETQQAWARGELTTDGMTRPYTTGDDDLDEFLRDPDEFIQMWAEDEDDETTMRAEMTNRIEQAEEQQTGDLGKVVAQLRDGNHRAFGAQLAGEPHVWLFVPGGYEGPLEEDELE